MGTGGVERMEPGKYTYIDNPTASNLRREESGSTVEIIGMNSFAY
jgi:hypothetical protein